MKNLNILLSEIASLTRQATSKQQAIELGLTSFLHLEYAKYYGGYRVVSIQIYNGGHNGALGESSCVNRRSNKEMTSFLNGYINALNN